MALFDVIFFLTRERYGILISRDEIPATVDCLDVKTN